MVRQKSRRSSGQCAIFQSSRKRTLDWRCAPICSWPSSQDVEHSPTAAVIRRPKPPQFKGPPLAGWQQVAEQELALASGHKTLTSWTARARSTVLPPRLDGMADEAFWHDAPPIHLTSPFDPASKLAASTAQFAYDHDYLYILLKCPYAAGAHRQERSRAQRQYDMSLDGSDHCHLVFDTDRDYTSACELAVNAAGHTFDRCCQAKEWNPRWYVAIDEGSQAWTAELAIKLSDVTTETAVAGRAWAISAFRYIPEVDVQSWSQLRSYNPRYQGNGLLLFEP
jgi:hypothetical protein